MAACAGGHRSSNLAAMRYPSHLDTILDPVAGEWWADDYGLARPPETFYRDRRLRDAMRARSQWEVRVAKLRNSPEPRRPGLAYTWEVALARQREDRRNGIVRPPSVDPYDLDWDQ